MCILNRLGELPFEFGRNVFLQYASGMYACTGLEVTRKFSDKEVADYLVPNSYDAWELYMDAQPEVKSAEFWEKYTGYFQGARDMLARGEIRVNRHVLYIDAYELLKRPSRETLSARKLLMLNQRHGFCEVVVFKLWEQLENTISSPPQFIFNKVFGSILRTNPRNVQILYDRYHAPKCIWDRQKINQGRYLGHHIFFQEHLTERQAYVSWRNELPHYDLTRSAEWYEQNDTWNTPITKDEMNPLITQNEYLDPSHSIAGCKNWNFGPIPIYIPPNHP